MLLPAFFMHINSTSGAVVDMGSGIFSANRAFHWLSPSIAANKSQRSVGGKPRESRATI
jgi:hypothetical protein